MVTIQRMATIPKIVITPMLVSIQRKDTIPRVTIPMTLPLLMVVTNLNSKYASTTNFWRTSLHKRRIFKPKICLHHAPAKYQPFKCKHFYIRFLYDTRDPYAYHFYVSGFVSCCGIVKVAEIIGNPIHSNSMKKLFLAVILT